MRIMFPKRSPSKIAKPKSERQTEDQRKPKTATAKTIIPQKKNQLLFSSFQFLRQKSALSFGVNGSGCFSVFSVFVLSPSRSSSMETENSFERRRRVSISGI